MFAWKPNMFVKQCTFLNAIFPSKHTTLTHCWVMSDVGQQYPSIGSIQKIKRQYQFTRRVSGYCLSARQYYYVKHRHMHVWACVYPNVVICVRRINNNCRLEHRIAEIMIHFATRLHCYIHPGANELSVQFFYDMVHVWRFPNTKHLYNNYTMLDQHRRRWAGVV